MEYTTKKNELSNEEKKVMDYVGFKLNQYMRLNNIEYTRENLSNVLKENSKCFVQEYMASVNNRS